MTSVTSVSLSESADLPTVTSDPWQGPNVVHWVTDVLRNAPSDSCEGGRHVPACACAYFCMCWSVCLCHACTRVRFALYIFVHRAPSLSIQVGILTPERWICCFHFAVSNRFTVKLLFVRFTANLFTVTTTMESFRLPRLARNAPKTTLARAALFLLCSTAPAEVYFACLFHIICSASIFFFFFTGSH